MPQIGPLEIAVVLLVALLVFGPKRLPELARQVGGALRELKRIQHSVTSEMRDLMADESSAAEPPPTLPPKEPGGTVDPDAIRAAGGVVPETPADGGESVAVAESDTGSGGEPVAADPAPGDLSDPFADDVPPAGP